MCTTLFAYNVHPQYPLIFISNRDELRARDTAEIHFWEDKPEIAGGRDLEAGGTWLGVHRDGRFANLTNYRDLRLDVLEDAPSRGDLPVNFLLKDADPEAYLRQIAQKANAYNGYNILVGSPESLYYFGNQGGKLQAVPAGVHGLSNHLLNTPWPKVKKGKAQLERFIQTGNWDKEQLFQLMLDTTQAPIEELPDTGGGIHFEQKLSSLFIPDPYYGTRCTTLILMGINGEIEMVERQYTADQKLTGEVALEWTREN